MSLFGEPSSLRSSCVRFTVVVRFLLHYFVCNIREQVLGNLNIILNEFRSESEENHRLVLKRFFFLIFLRPNFRQMGKKFPKRQIIYFSRALDLHPADYAHL